MLQNEASIFGNGVESFSIGAFLAVMHHKNAPIRWLRQALHSMMPAPQRAGMAIASQQAKPFDPLAPWN
ncbi:MAG: hypothetical protein ACKVOO_02800 [Burkholderiaceae bacterium]